jgi:hypothetical protein
MAIVKKTWTKIDGSKCNLHQRYYLSESALPLFNNKPTHSTAHEPASNSIYCATARTARSFALKESGSRDVLQIRPLGRIGGWNRGIQEELARINLFLTIRRGNSGTFAKFGRFDFIGDLLIFQRLEQSVKVDNPSRLLWRARILR